MGLDTVPSRSNAQTITDEWFNVWRRVLAGDVVPRNTSGVATSQAGSLGSTTYPWLNAYLAKLYAVANTGNSVYMQAPTGLSASYGVTLPSALPGAAHPTGKHVVKITEAGVMYFEALARTDLPSVGQQITSSCGTYTPAGTGTYYDVTNLSASLTTSGRPVFIAIIPDGSNRLYFDPAAALGAFQLAIVRSGTTIAETLHTCGDDVTNQVSIMTIDAPAAGTYTYKIQIKTLGSNGTLYNAKMACFEL